MKDFIIDGKTYILDNTLRDQLRPDWKVMLSPAKDRLGKGINIPSFAQAVLTAESCLNENGYTFVGKTILEVGCNEGARSYILAKYHDTYVHGIDVDEYTVEQSPDMNIWNPNDVAFVHSTFGDMRKGLGAKFPSMVSDKVTFSTADITQYTPNDGIYDIIVSWDVLEHILDLPKAFEIMGRCLYAGGLMYHEYNPFLSINGGHSLCTIDFMYGHCRLTNSQFEKYIQEYRPVEEKIAINFFTKCLNRATIADVKKCAIDNGFEILSWQGITSFTEHQSLWRKKIESEFLPDVVKLYPTATWEDLYYPIIQTVMRKI